MAPAPYGLVCRLVPHHFPILEHAQTRTTAPPSRSGRDRTRAPLEVGGAAPATLDSFIERKPPFARASICFPEKQVTARDACPAPALYLGPVNASNLPAPPPSPASYTLPIPFVRATRLQPPPLPTHTLPHASFPPSSPPRPHSPQPRPHACSRPPSRRRSGCRCNGRDRPARAAGSEQGPGGRQIWGIALGQ